MSVVQQQAYTWTWDIGWHLEGVRSLRLSSALMPYLHRSLGSQGSSGYEHGLGIHAH